MADAGGIKAGAAYVLLTVRDATKAGLDAVQRRLQAMGAGLTAVGGLIAGAGTAAIASLVGMSKVFAEMGDHMAKASERTGVTVEVLGGLKFAAESSGAGLGDIELALRRVSSTLSDAAKGGNAARQRLRELGLTLADLKGLTPDQQFKLIGDRLSKIENPAKRSALAVDLFGRSGTRLLPLLKSGAKGIEELEERYKALGLAMTGEEAKSAEELGDRFDELKKQSMAVAFAVGSAVAPVLKDVIGIIQPVLANVIQWTRNNATLIQSALKLAGVAVAVGTAIGGVGTALLVLASPAGPLVAVVAGVTLVGGALLALVSSGDTVEERLGNMWSNLVSLGEWALDGILLVVAGAVVAFNRWEQVVALLPEAFDAAFTLTIGTFKWAWENIKIMADWLGKNWLDMIKRALHNALTMFNNFGGLLAKLMDAIVRKLANPLEAFRFDFGDIGKKLTRGLVTPVKELPKLIGRELDEAERAALERLGIKLDPLAAEAQELAKKLKKDLFNFGAPVVGKAGLPPEREDLAEQTQAAVRGTFSADVARAGGLGVDSLQKRIADGVEAIVDEIGGLRGDLGEALA